MKKLIINLKAYDKGVLNNSLKIAKAVKSVQKEAKKRNVEIILCAQSFDLKELVKLKVNVYSQHIDPICGGAHTGFISPYHIKKIGVKGTLINHSEHQLRPEILEKTIKEAKKSGLEVCVCARNSSFAKKISQIKPKPDFIAVEPKELIGGNISISTAKPQLIINSKKAIGRIPLLIGAGVKNSNDVEVGIKLGAKGILVASGIVCSQNPKKSILQLLEGFN